MEKLLYKFTHPYIQYKSVGWGNKIILIFSQSILIIKCDLK